MGFLYFLSKPLWLSIDGAMKTKGMKIALAVLAGLMVVLGGISTAYATHYSNRALPGVTLAGESLTGKDAAQIEQLIKDKVDGMKFTITADKMTATKKLKDLGMSVDTEAIVREALNPNQRIGSRFSALWKDREVPVTIKVDDKASKKAAIDLLNGVGVAATDAQIRFDEEKSTFIADPSKKGKGVVPEELVKKVKESAASLSSSNIEMKITELNPKVDDKAAEKIVKEANEYLGASMTLNTRIGDQVPSAAQKAGWLSIDPVAAKVEVNRDAIQSWVNDMASQSNVEMVKGERWVRPSGEEIRVVSQGSAGYQANNVDEQAKALADAFAEKAEFSGQLSYQEQPAEIVTVERNIAPGAEYLAYPAAVGEKWIDINLSTNMLTAYEGATVVNGPMGIIPGAPGMETPTGQFAVYLKYQSQTMRGTNMDGTTYVAPGVPWVSYITGSIAIHGAPWHDHFGWSGPGGSHGCINMDPSNAEWIWHWAPIGTVAVVHY